jgi:hypothetical protein
MKNTLYILIAFVIFACETEINPTLNPAEEVLVVDAWLNDKDETQKIFLTKSQPYFDQSQPQLVDGAKVFVKDLNTGEVFPFVEEADYYSWTPDGKSFGEIGHSYQLLVNVEEETYSAVASMGAVPEVDSVLFRYNPEDFSFQDPYFTAEFTARDLPGLGDAYWIKAWKNGTYLSRPSEINIAFDAGIFPSQPVDGEIFHQIIRRDFVNPLDEAPENANTYLPPYTIGDSLYVEIHSISPQAFDFLSQLITQTNRPGGFSELFATPLANVSTNIETISEGSNLKVVGFFNVSGVTAGGGKLTEDIAEAAENLALVEE